MHGKRMAHGVAGGALGDGGLAGGILKLAQHRDDGGELALGMVWG